MNIFYLYSQPRKGWERQVKQSRMPDHVLYGLNWLRKFGHKVTYSDIAFSRFNLLKWLISPLQRWFLNRFGVGFQLDQALLLLPRLRQADVIITTNDSCGLPVAFFKWLGLLKTPQIYFHIGFKPNPCLSRLLRQSEAVVHFSTTPPGVDTKFFHPQKLTPKFDILAIGRDPGRDYATLFQAIKDLPVKAKVICDPKNVADLTIPFNVDISYSVSYLEVRQAYWESKIVVIPTQKNSVSGQITFLEALACGKPVIAANTKALKIAPANYYRSEQPQSLQQQILHSQRHSISRRIVENFSSQAFAVKIDHIALAIHPRANKPH